ncbi:MAG: diguanylate cyclase [Lachnospiraceae bacterium]|nr:diguanylate cyclase [Lachnospiraceae bacterium]
MKNKLNRTTKYLILISIFLIAVIFTLGVVLTQKSSNAMKSLIRSRMLDISNTAAAMLDGDALGSIEAADIDTPQYQSVLKTLTYFQDNIDLQYIYCIRDMGNKNFVFTIDPTVDDPGIFGEPIIYTDSLYQASLGKPSVDDQPYEDRWGRFYSSYSPVFDSKGNVSGIVAVDFSADWYDKQISDLYYCIAIIGTMTLALGIVFVLMVASRSRKRYLALYKELNELSNGIEDLADELSESLGATVGNELLHKSHHIENHSLDEMSVLGDKIHDLQEYMRKQLSIIRSKAYVDESTGLDNRTSYLSYIESVDECIQRNDIEFAIGMFDINSLKEINDTLGHEVGDKAIIKIANILKQTFESEKIFRIGGDEFVVILKADDNEMERYFNLFDGILAKANEKDDLKVDVSKGFAIYDNEYDRSYKRTFVRADYAMYADKKAYYETHRDRRRN